MSLAQLKGKVRARSHGAYIGYLVHRLSGLALTLFLPAHFLVLGLALNGEKDLDNFLFWTKNPWVRGGEWLLVTALALHMAGGLRILALEFLPWTERQKTWISISFAFAIGVGLIFLLSQP